METEVIVSYIVGGMGGLLLMTVVGSIINTRAADSQKRILTGIATTNGLLMALGLSPRVTIAQDLVGLSSLLPAEFAQAISTLILVETAYSLFLGIESMKRGSGFLGMGAFLLAFVSGMLIPHQATALVGGLLLTVAIMLVELSPSKQYV